KDDDEQQSWGGAFEAVSIGAHGSSIWIWIAWRNARWKHKPLLSAEGGTTEQFWSFHVVLTTQITIMHFPKIMGFSVMRPRDRRLYPGPRLVFGRVRGLQSVRPGRRHGSPSDRR